LPHTRAFMTEHNWTFEYEVADAAFLPVMNLSKYERVRQMPVKIT
jgi:hypothetical protein